MREVSRPQGEVFLDARGNGRAMRLTWHHEADLVVLSMWREGTCAGTFRLAKDDVNPFIDALIDGLRDAPGVQVAAPTGAHRAPGVLPTGHPEPHEAAHTGESTYPELSDVDSVGDGAETSDSDGDDQDHTPFTEWAFGDQANAS